MRGTAAIPGEGPGQTETMVSRSALFFPSDGPADHGSKRRGRSREEAAYTRFVLEHPRIV